MRLTRKKGFVYFLIGIFLVLGGFIGSLMGYLVAIIGFPIGVLVAIVGIIGIIGGDSGEIGAMELMGRVRERNNELRGHGKLERMEKRIKELERRR